MRNDTLSIIGDLNVRALHLGCRRTRLGRGNLAAVDRRDPPGEPVPVALSSEASTSEVGSVKYDFSYTKCPPAYRQLTTLEVRFLPRGQEGRSAIPKEIAGNVGDAYLTVINAVNAGCLDCFPRRSWPPRC